MLPSNNFARPYFNPRSPCGERHFDMSIPEDWVRFQSTLSLRRATISSESIVMI